MEIPYGQPDALSRLERFLESPKSEAFLFYGPTGTGKTMAAQYVADMLQVDRSSENYREVDSEALRHDPVKALIDSICRYRQLGWWRVYVVDICSHMKLTVAGMWNGLLDKLPPNVLIIFTTVKRDFFTHALVDRCQMIEFVADEQLVRQYAKVEWERKMPGSRLPEQLLVAGTRPNVTPSYRRAKKDVEDAVEVLSGGLLEQADFRQWIVHDGITIYYNTGPDNGKEAREALDCIQKSVPEVKFYLARTVETDKKGVSVPREMWPVL